MIYEKFIQALEKSEGVPPIIIDEIGCLELLTKMTKKHLTSLDECRTGELTNIYLYEIPEEKKLFDITTVRTLIADMSLVPYEGKNIYILRDFDLATHQAMNSLLKALEDCPKYASIIIVVHNPESLLETIHSRSMNLYREISVGKIDPELIASFKKFLIGDVGEFTAKLFGGKIEKTEALGLLRYAILYGPESILERAEQGIIDIRMSHELPRNILDSIFFIPR